MSTGGKYKDSLNLPQTEFAMRGSLATREPEFLQRWTELGLYERLQGERAEAPTYILHDGPPYANGNIHYGHILNKILKDLVVKYRSMAGFRAPYVPGWDTHGLPIEIAVDRELGKKKRDMSPAQIRSACRDYALKFVDVQRQEFQRLGIFGEWDKPYLTLDHSYEAAIVRALAAFAKGGYLYRGKKPVYWCPTHRTALAEAEIEYHEHTSPSIYVRFAMDPSFDPGSLDRRLAGQRLAVVIWTTTPWTLPANLAIVLHKDFDYVALPSPRDAGEYLVVAKELVDPFLKAIGGEDSDRGTWVELDRKALKAFEGARYRHPFVRPKSDNDFKIWFADYVTLEQGTGLVHTAPGHGLEDYATGVKHGLEVYAPVDDAGRFTSDVDRWAGKKAFEANPEIVEYLHEIGALLSSPKATVTHQYPHSWRSKQPVLFRATDQWFLSVDHADLRKRALQAIDDTEWVPPWGRNRIYGMVENRPDWVLSRQRLWGVPIPVFYCTACDTVHADGDTMEHIADIFAEHGADAWYSRPVSELLPANVKCDGCGGAEFRPEHAIVDVWFESGVSWLAVCENNPRLGAIDLYLEGSDQHRGWFHSSLLVAMGVAGKAPYKTVLTHGFVLNEEGHPYSKSEIEKARREGKQAKYIAPEDIINKYGAELFRLWAASTEFRNDITYSEELLQTLIDWYRRFRNTSRFMLGNLFDYSPTTHSLETVTLTEIDKYALARLRDVTAKVRKAYDKFEFHVAYKSLVDYIANDLSALYFDVIKDRLYTNARNSADRRATQAVLYEIVRSLAALTAPILCFTAEDIWQHLPKLDDDPPSVHLTLMPEGAELQSNSDVVTRWNRLIDYRERVNKAMEPFRAQKNRTTDATVSIRPAKGDGTILRGSEDMLAELFIVSQVVIIDEAAAEPIIEVTQSPGTRCERCWKWYVEMSSSDPELCLRCGDAVSQGA